MKEKDSGIVSFEVSQDLNESNVFHFWERYESNSQMGKHNTCPEMTKFLEDVSRPYCTLRPAQVSAISEVSVTACSSITCVLVFMLLQARLKTRFSPFYTDSR